VFTHWPFYPASSGSLKKSQNQITTRPNAFKILKELAIFMKELVVLRPVI
jgi:hypothetical protein